MKITAKFVYNSFTEITSEIVMLTIVQEALTFDDVYYFLPTLTVLPKDVSLKTRLTRGIQLNIPLFLLQWIR